MNTKKFIAIAISAALAFSACTKKDEAAKTESTQSTTAETATSKTTAAAAKVEIQDVEPGKGAEAVNGKSITVHYTGTLKDGTKFDSSVDRNEPFTFTLGAGQVIKGWEQGILGMKVGGKRKLTIPPELAYGNNAVGAIPANSTLIFDVKLIDVK
ncbi:MAG: FKBP-type peptidyl-prolyl cis-trans isomerase [Bdellovibrionales bacterium]|nr:FKBP-type peptidyl-prolyl cis-trans isomerase [Bdellovibrionales bacterium]